MKPPNWFVQELAAFDPDLRVRWSPRLCLWQIERRVRRALHPGTISCDGWKDDVIRARDGYLLVASVPAGSLTGRIFELLRASDLWSQGGWKSMSDKLDAADERREELLDRKFSEDLKDLDGEAYRFLSLRRGSTVFSPGWVE